VRENAGAPLAMLREVCYQTSPLRGGVAAI